MKVQELMIEEVISRENANESILVSQPNQQQLWLNAFIESFGTRLNKSQNEYLKRLSEEAFSEFLKQGFPSQDLEEWKYISLDFLCKTKFTSDISLKEVNTQISGNSIENSLQKFSSPEANLIVLIDGSICSKYSQIKNLSKEILFEPLTVAIEKYPNLFNKYFNQIQKQNDCFSNLNLSFANQAENGLFLYIPEDLSCEKPLEIFLLSTSSINHPRNLIILGDNSKAEISLITLLATGSELQSDEMLSLANIVNEIHLSENASLELSYLQLENSKSFEIASTNASIMKGAELKLHSFALGGLLAKHKINIDLLEENSHCSLNGLYVLNEEQASHNQVSMNHHKPHCTSSQLYKGILDDKSRGEFSGKITVSPKAIGTNAKQLNRNLLLSSKAKVDTRPQLEILADDVKCSHGATTGKISDEQIFYLLSRGISHEKAKAILTYGFAEEIIEKVHSRALREAIDRIVNSKINI
jgi:Fe-S cluster assembly protein SufD